MGRFISDNPFSTLAMTSMAGDACYLGYALHAPQGASLIRLIGALAALAGNVFILAYGDAHAGKIALEKGWCAGLFLVARRGAKRLMVDLTSRHTVPKPLFRGFGLLAVNGVSLIADASVHPSALAPTQMLLGFFIFLGCSCFAAADLVDQQRWADRLTKLAPSLLACANIPGFFLGLAARNAFLLFATLLFLIGNLAGFFTRIDKTRT